MLYDWVMLWDRLMKEERRRSDCACHPLADPLEGAQWRGLLWVVPLLSRLSVKRGGRWLKRKSARRTARMAVNGWSRSSAG